MVLGNGTGTIIIYDDAQSIVACTLPNNDSVFSALQSFGDRFSVYYIDDVVAPSFNGNQDTTFDITSANFPSDISGAEDITSIAVQKSFSSPNNHVAVNYTGDNILKIKRSGIITNCDIDAAGNDTHDIDTIDVDNFQDGDIVILRANDSRAVDFNIKSSEGNILLSDGLSYKLKGYETIGEYNNVLALQYCSEYTNQSTAQWIELFRRNRVEDILPQETPPSGEKFVLTKNSSGTTQFESLSSNAIGYSIGYFDVSGVAAGATTTIATIPASLVMGGQLILRTGIRFTDGEVTLTLKIGNLTVFSGDPFDIVPASVGYYDTPVTELGSTSNVTVEITATTVGAEGSFHVIVPYVVI